MAAIMCGIMRLVLGISFTAATIHLEPNATIDLVRVFALQIEMNYAH